MKIEYNVNTIYKYIENNIDGKRTQSLPEVIGVNIKDTKPLNLNTMIRKIKKL